jgi:sugar phosphate isomerase/epimerase
MTCQIKHGYTIITDSGENMITLSTGTLRCYELEKVFRISADLGFDGVELIVDERRHTRDPAYLKKLSGRYQQPIMSIHSPFGFVRTPDWGEDPVERMKRSVELAGELGSEAVVIHLPFFAERRYARWVKNELPLWQKQTRIKLAVENMPLVYKLLGRLGVALHAPSFYKTGRHVIVRNIMKPVSRLCFLYNDWESILGYEHLVLDTTHLATGGIDPVEAYERMKEKLALIHVSNFNGCEHQRLDNGIMDMKGFLRHVKTSGYNGIVVLELMPEYFPDKTEAGARKILKNDLALCRSCL